MLETGGFTSAFAVAGDGAEAGLLGAGFSGKELGRNSRTAVAAATTSAALATISVFFIGNRAFNYLRAVARATSGLFWRAGNRLQI
jgi:hypothetical protein